MKRRRASLRLFRRCSEAAATIEAKWNLPALTYQEANAATVMDFLNVNQAPTLSVPNIRAP